VGPIRRLARLTEAVCAGFAFPLDFRLLFAYASAHRDAGFTPPRPARKRAPALQSDTLHLDTLQFGAWPDARLQARPGAQPNMRPAPVESPQRCEVVRTVALGSAPGVAGSDPAVESAPLGRPAKRIPDGPAQSIPHLLWDDDAASPDSTEEIEDRLARLAGAVGALRRSLAAVAERLIASRAHERLCYARLADYARERLGLSGRQLQELARVHRALAGLPALERALLANELPWSKVRLIARVATAEDEEAWIARARAMPTRRLEEEVRRIAGEEAPGLADEGGPEKRVAVRCTPAVREKWGLAREMAERVAGQRLRAGEALELIAAEVFSTISIDPAFAEMPDERPARQPGEAARAPGEPLAPAVRPRSPGLPRSIESLTAGLDEADAFELDRRLRRAVRLEQTLDAAIAPLLRVVTSPEYEWRGDSYWPLPSYAREQLGMSPSKARALLRLERAGDICPELRDAYRSGRLSWVKAQCLLPLLLLDIPGEWRPIWVAWAERVTVRRLEGDMERALLLRAGHSRAGPRCLFHPEQAQDPIPPEEEQMCAPGVDLDATQLLAWRVPYPVAGLFAAVRETLRAKLRPERGHFLHDGEVFDAMLDCALLAWTLREPGARSADPVIARDGYLCAVPGCTSRRSLHDHHLRFRSAGGCDEASNRTTLCAFHHQRCLHAGLLRILGRAPDGLLFELGLRRGTPPLARYRSGDIEVV
jgi:hypothetical protein